MQQCWLKLVSHCLPPRASLESMFASAILAHLQNLGTLTEYPHLQHFGCLQIAHFELKIHFKPVLALKIPPKKTK